ncbi:hypothetical protein R0J93_28875, partial [Pseudoalteromonas sp. SIMBA_148]
AIELQHCATHWQILDAQGSVLAEAPRVILCCAHDTAAFEQTAHLPLKAIRGQLTHLPTNTQSAELRTVLCADGYISP